MSSRGIFSVIPTQQPLSQLACLHMLLFCHSGLDPESTAFSRRYVSGCRIESGMTIRKKAIF
jgi:hypothetical protein